MRTFLLVLFWSLSCQCQAASGAGTMPASGSLLLIGEAILCWRWMSGPWDQLSCRSQPCFGRQRFMWSWGVHVGSELFDFKITSNPSQRVSTGLNISQTIHIYNHIIQTYPRHFCVTASHSWKKQFKRSCIESLSLSLFLYTHPDWPG